MVEITLSQKQQTAFRILDDPAVVEVTSGGGAGGGKSWLVCLWSVIQCRNYAGIRIGLGRKAMTNLSKTTGQSLLAELHPVLGAKDFRYSSLVDPGIHYRNSSQILYTDLAPAPSDPNYDRLGSLNLTHVIIEDAGEVVREAAKVFTSRRNRYLNKRYGITGKTSTPATRPPTSFARSSTTSMWAAATARSGSTPTTPVSRRTLSWPTADGAGQAGVHQEPADRQTNS